MFRFEGLEKKVKVSEIDPGSDAEPNSAAFASTLHTPQDNSCSGTAPARIEEAAREAACHLPIRILREFWGPSSGRHAFTQRLFQVLFPNGKKLKLVAEDVVDVVDEPFEENEFYTSVLRVWRDEHPEAPTNNRHKGT
jgi:hypothetical protein